MTDAAFLAAFEAASLTRAQWTHEAHVRMAWLYARREPRLEAVMAKARTGIQRLNAALGTDPALYHETVTCAFATLVYTRAVAPHAPDTWPAFRDAHPELFDRERPILLAYYTRAQLESEEARLSFIAPDKTELPRAAGHSR